MACGKKLGSRRRCGLRLLGETLERRLLLAVDAWEYDTIRARYPQFNLPADMANVNIIEIEPADLSLANMRAAIATAAGTGLPDLVVARTDQLNNFISYQSGDEELAIDIPASQGSISIIGSGLYQLTFSGYGWTRPLSIGAAGGSTTTVNLGFVNITGGSDSGNGGGILSQYGTLAIVESAIYLNSAGGDGGGLYADHTNLTLRNVSVTSNSAGNGGGGLYLGSASTQLSELTLAENSAVSGGGGLLQDQGTLVVHDAAIWTNTAGYGGGLCELSGTMTAVLVEFKGNSAAAHGGAVYQIYGTTTLNGAMLLGNSAGFDGGGLFEVFGFCTLNDVSIAGNSAGGRGGGLYVSESIFTVNNSIIAKNTASSGPDMVGRVSAQYNLIGDGSGAQGLENSLDRNMVGTAANPVDPRFRDTSNTDHSQWNLRLQGTSPAVDRGNNALVPAGITTDLEGKQRILNSVVDMGAYEYTNLGPTEISLSPGSVYENRPVGSDVGRLSTTDLDTSATFTYALVSGAGADDNGSFVIVANWVLTAAVFDHEAKAIYSIRVRSTNDSGLWTETMFYVYVGDLNERPTDISLSNTTVAENQPIGTAVGTFSASDPDAGDTFTYNLVDGAGSNDNSAFAIVGSQLRTVAAFNYEARSSYSIRVRVTDHSSLLYQGSQWYEKVLTVSVIDVNDSPTNMSLSASAVPENLPAGSAVGDFSAIDPDADNTFTYSLVSGFGSTNNSSFAIVGGQLRTATSFNHEAKSSYTIRVRVTDQGGLWYEKVFGISVANVNETPTDISLSSSGVAENQPSGTAVGNFSASDPDAGSSFTYMLVSGTGSEDNASFAIVGGQLQTAASFDYEAQDSYSIRVRATDAGGLWFEKSFTISVTDVEDRAPVQITGTEGADQISVTVDAGRYAISVNGDVSYFWIGHVESLSIAALGGEDVVTVGSGVMGVTVDGGSGNDSITGGEGNDAIRGDDGADTICGGAGDDSVMGNTGDDSLSGGDGADQIQAGLGYDWLAGGLGNDSLYAGDQMDTVYGDEGDDYIEGRGKADTIYGGSGNDTILGGAGSDLIYAEEGEDRIWVGISGVFRDTVDGGAGSDVSDGDEGDVLSDVESVLA